MLSSEGLRYAWKFVCNWGFILEEQETSRKNREGTQERDQKETPQYMWLEINTVYNQTSTSMMFGNF